jgi:hypothetical protein
MYQSASAALGILILVMLASCRPAKSRTSDMGNVTVSVRTNSKRVIRNREAIVRHDLLAFGPGGATRHATGASFPIAIDEIAAGRWYVVVSAEDADGTLVAIGDGHVTARDGTTRGTAVRMWAAGRGQRIER